MIDEILFRCHSIGDLMGVKGLGDTGKKRAIYTYLEYKYGRRKSIKSKYLEKGIACEHLSFRMIKNVLGLDLVKNDLRKDNEFITGECDSIHNKCVIDVKNSWDIFTFNDSTLKLNTDYEWQLRCYMELFDCDSAKLIYTLNNAPESLVLKALESESYNHPGHEIPEWIEVEIIKSMIFTNDEFERFITMRGLGGDEITEMAINSFIEIPEEERLFEYNFTRDDSKYQLITSRVKEAREFLKTKYQINGPATK